MNCCNDYGECQHGPNCPAGPATLPPFHLTPHSCEALGICQHPDRECPGGCEMVAPGKFELQPGAVGVARRERFVYQLLYAATVGVALGAVR